VRLLEDQSKAWLRGRGLAVPADRLHELLVREGQEVAEGQDLAVFET
jgi:multidrug efflux pump subunit AcrA (membrane-fusion protein)